MILKQSTSLFIKELTLDPCPKNKNCWHRWHFVFFKIQKNPQNFCVFFKYFEQISTNILPKDWSEMKMTNVFSKISLVKSSKFFFIFLSVFYLTICLMKALKSFGKRGILKTWELVSLGGAKIHFGKIAMK